MKKVLIVITTGFVPYGGLTTVMMNYYRAMDKTDLQIDFASTNEIGEEMRNELIANDSKYFCLGDRKKHLFTYQKNLIKVLKKENYDVVHINGNSTTMLFDLLPAKLCGVKKRIVHVHNTRSDYPILNKFLKPFFKASYTDAIATSKDAGDWLYGENYAVLNNAIDTKKYAFNQEIREKIRKKLGLRDEFVIGNIGKLNPQKNQTYLLDIFASYKQRNKNSKLVIGGGGNLESELKEKAKDLDIENDVIFLGMVNNVEEVIQAFDCFVFTSIFEGLGMALIEAQASGLKCISSDVVPIETKVTDNISYLSLECLPDEWAKNIEKITKEKIDRNELSRRACKSIASHGYMIEREADKLLQIYVGQ